MGRTMGGYIPTDQEFVTELCNARDCCCDGWERAAAAWRGYWKTEYGSIVTLGYGEYLQGKNLPEITEVAMRSTTVWRDWGGARWPSILDEVKASPSECQRIITIAVDRYRGAARKLLGGIAFDHADEGKFNYLSSAELLDGDDIPSIRTGMNYNGETFNIQSVYQFFEDSLTERELVVKVIVLQVLQKMIDNALRKDQPQPTTQAADQQRAELVDCPADIQKKRRADLFIFFDECLRLANSDEKGFYQKGIPHRPKKGEKSQRDYLIPLCKKYHNTENIDGLLETFERKFRAYKADKLSG